MKRTIKMTKKTTQKKGRYFTGDGDLKPKTQEFGIKSPHAKQIKPRDLTKKQNWKDAPGSQQKLKQLSGTMKEEVKDPTTISRTKKKRLKKIEKKNKTSVKKNGRPKIEMQKKTSSKKNQSPVVKELRKDPDPFPGDKPIPSELIEKYKRGQKKADTETRTRYHTKIMKKKEEKTSEVVKSAARTEILLEEDGGFLQADEGEKTTDITQHEIASAVDVTSAQKFFELKLNDFGPYRINYTRNGRFLLFGGSQGHVAAVDWMTKKLLSEINVMETVNDVKWLHQETMYAVAQRKWTYIYDNQGIELHCLKVLDSVLRMEFLPYHFLLASANNAGHLSYIDVSVGQKVAGYGTGMGRLDVMCQNPSNAIVSLGHSGGTVTMWCPKLKQPVVKMLCHNSGVRSIAIDKTGSYLATSGIDRTMKIWDLRTYKLLQSYKVAMGAGQLGFSQKGFLAAGMGNVVQVFNDCCRQTVSTPYLVHQLTSSVNSVQFCPYEDVLGVGHNEGFTSLLVPGAGEANFDALEENPYQTKTQRRQAEVKMLLEKIPADMIHIDSSFISQVDRKTLKEKIESHNQKKFLKPSKLEFEPKYKKKGRSKGAKVIKRKKGVQEEHQRSQIRQSVHQRQRQDKDLINNKQRELADNKQKQLKTGQATVLDRFKRKT